MNTLFASTHATAPRLPLPVATGVATVLVLALLTLAAMQAGLASWLDGLIYLVAAVPLALGLKEILRHRWLDDRSAKRKGLVFLIVAWALTVDAWTNVKANRASLAAREQRLEPVITALARFHAVHGVYPVSLAALGAEGRLPEHAHAYYTGVEGGSYLLVFRHELLVDHRFSPERGFWIDTL